MLFKISRNYSSKVLTSQEIRRKFLDFFIRENEHKLIRSSPVVPYCDPSVVFVNAGMNQFKNVFLGKTAAPCTKAANSQKCIRVGGKHNDLSIVGTDGYHHTFFEMLGNWSFGNYFKKEACEYAWKLLTGPYGIDPRCLYVTYFGGNTELQLQPDTECLEIWRSLNVPLNRIIPFGLRDNFWEMGTTGPCGPCTEIHIDHTRDIRNANNCFKVNCGDPSLTELWNIVFIEYNRNLDGTVAPLPKKHIDTGMGMERLVAYLQNKSSNYETDLFKPIFEQIHKVTGSSVYQDQYNSKTNDLNVSYRIMADHSRMIVACLADSLFPDQNHKLRRILRKTFKISKQSFNTDDLLMHIVPTVVDILGETYPEMQRNLVQIQQVIDHEQDAYKSLLQATSKELKEILQNNPSIEEDEVISLPGFLPAYKELKSKCKNSSTMSGDLVFKLYDTYGLNEEIIQKIAKIENLKLDKDGFHALMDKTRRRTKNLLNNDEQVNVFNQNLVNNDLPTDNTFKYNYVFNVENRDYEVENIKANVIQINQRNNTQCDVILNKSNFYYEAGGQQSDIGKITNGNTVFKVDNISFENEHIIHSGTYTNGQFNIGDQVELIVNNQKRSCAIRNHTATHLLNAGVRHVTKSVVYQKSSNVTFDKLKLELGVIGTKLRTKDIENIETFIRNVIKEEIPINIKHINGYDLYGSNDITIIPGEIYPDHDIRIVSIEKDNKLKSLEPCCGTHAFNTGELIDFCITEMKQTGRGSYTFTAVTGIKAIKAHELDKEMLTEIGQIKNDFEKKTDKNDKFQGRVLKLKLKLLEGSQEVSYPVKQYCLDIVNEIDQQIKDVYKDILREFINIEMKTVLDTCRPSSHPFIVHYLSCSGLMTDVPLHQATQHCTDRPILILSLSENNLRARCCVPKDRITKDFSAIQWIRQVADVFPGSSIASPQGKSIEQIANMKSKKIPVASSEEKVELAIQEANKYATKHLIS